MKHFSWSPENEVFLGQIDAEHRELFKLAAALQHTMEKGFEGNEMREALEALATHTEEHFQHEEWLMQSVSYPAYGWHKQQHETARRRLKLFVPLIEKGDSEAGELFLEFLSGWLHDHVSISDRMMASHVRNYERSHATSAFERWGEPPERRRPATSEGGPYPRTLRPCKACGVQTTHEMRPDGIVCLKCAERSVSADLDRE